MRLSVVACATTTQLLLQNTEAVQLSFPSNDVDLIEFAQVEAGLESFEQNADVPISTWNFAQSYAEAHSELGVDAEVLNQLLSELESETMMSKEEVFTYVMEKYKSAYDKGKWAIDAIQKGAEMLRIPYVGEVLELVSAFTEGNEFIQTVLSDPTELTVGQTVSFMKSLPIVGKYYERLDSVVDGSTKLLKTAKRFRAPADAKTCYRSSTTVRTYEEDSSNCSAPNTLVKSTCYHPCPTGTAPYGMLCLEECTGDRLVECGMLCTRKQKSCLKYGVNGLVEIANAGVLVTSITTGQAALAWLAVFDSAIKLINTFAHPAC